MSSNGVISLVEFKQNYLTYPLNKHFNLTCKMQLPRKFNVQKRT